jgi:hypothetical protein
MKYSGVTAMMVLSGAMVLLTGSIASGGGETVLWVNEAGSKSFATTNCKAPAFAKGYPCFPGDPTEAVGILLNEVKNHLLADPFCEGIQLPTRPGSKPADWALQVEIAFGDEHEPPRWVLTTPGKIQLPWGGRDRPADIAHIVCGIIAHKGAKQID